MKLTPFFIFQFLVKVEIQLIEGTRIHWSCTFQPVKQTDIVLMTYRMDCVNLITLWNMSDLLSTVCQVIIICSNNYHNISFEKKYSLMICNPLLFLFLYLLCPEIIFSGTGRTCLSVPPLWVKLFTVSEGVEKISFTPACCRIIISCWLPQLFIHWAHCWQKGYI